jgi:hypothetical protein
VTGYQSVNVRLSQRIRRFDPDESET